jgi:23S rRNA pseudouridine1911/1915/1917 synthase
MKKKNKTIHIPRGRGTATLQQALSHHLNISGRAAKKLLDDRRVLVNGKRIWIARHQLNGGEQLEVIAEQEASKKIRILHKDGQLIVADKPAGILTNGPSSLETTLRTQLKLPTLRAVHRLDRHTSGCLLFTSSETIYKALVEQFRSRNILKIYHAIVHGKWEDRGKQLRAKIDGLDAITSVRLLDGCAMASHLAVRIETGRTHQIRKHLALAGYPVLGDREHGRQRLEDTRLRMVPRQMLHNTVLEFDNPKDRTRVRVTSPLPGDFKSCLNSFRLT